MRYHLSHDLPTVTAGQLSFTVCSRSHDCAKWKIQRRHRQFHTVSLSGSFLVGGRVREPPPPPRSRKPLRLLVVRTSKCFWTLKREPSDDDHGSQNAERTSVSGGESVYVGDLGGWVWTWCEGGTGATCCYPSHFRIKCWDRPCPFELLYLISKDRVTGRADTWSSCPEAEVRSQGAGRPHVCWGPRPGLQTAPSPAPTLGGRGEGALGPLCEDTISHRGAPPPCTCHLPQPRLWHRHTGGGQVSARGFGVEGKGPRQARSPQPTLWTNSQRVFELWHRATPPGADSTSFEADGLFTLPRRTCFIFTCR